MWGTRGEARNIWKTYVRDFMLGSSWKLQRGGTRRSSPATGDGGMEKAFCGAGGIYRMPSVINVHV